jgi:ribonucleoside-diphosphate reductase alpha chain
MPSKTKTKKSPASGDVKVKVQQEFVRPLANHFLAGLDKAHRDANFLQEELSLDVWRDKYKWTTDDTVEDMCWRVATAINGGDGRDHVEAAYLAMVAGLWVPAGRILAGAGTAKRVTLVNCFVNAKMIDEMEHIQDCMKYTALTMQQGGGMGTSFETLRPSGALLKRTHSKASGPLPFMDQMNGVSRTIRSAGDRRGAMMGTISDTHPDLPHFIVAKQEKGRLTEFNVSILISDAFMQAVADNEQWLLHFSIPPMTREYGLDAFDFEDDEGVHQYVYAQWNARALWEFITRNTYEWSEPGIIFIDRVNDFNNLKEFEDIRCTNPCVAAGTLVSTPNGFIAVETIKPGDPITTVAGTRSVTKVEKHESTPVFKVVFKSGQELRVTAAHIFHVWDVNKEMRKRTRSPTWKREHDQWIASGSAWSKETRLDQLEPGATIRMAPGNTPANLIENAFGWSQRDYGFLMGVLLGDGCYTEGNPYIKIAVGTEEPTWIEVLKTTLRRMGEEGSLLLNENPSRGSSASIQLSQAFASKIRGTALLQSLSYNKSIPLSMLNSNADFLWGMFDGLICTDGVINKHSLGGIIKLTTSSPDLARDFSRLCHLLEMNARIYKSFRTGNVVTIVGKEVTCKRDMYEVCITGEHFHRVNSSIILSHPRKASALKEHCKTFEPQGDKYRTEVVSIEPDGVADVYDLFEETTDTWVTEGIVNRGCGEQPLPPHGACNLGHVNVGRLVKVPFTNAASFDWKMLEEVVRIGQRFLDNVIDVSGYPLPEQEAEQKAKRRTGLGITGLADAMVQLQMRYGSPQSVDFAERVMNAVAEASYAANIVLAEEKGPAPILQDSNVRKRMCNNGSFVATRMGKFHNDIELSGLRNSVALTVAPTGTTSVVFGNLDGSGCESAFAHVYDRKVRQPNTDGSLLDVYKTYKGVCGYSHRLWKTLNPNEGDDFPAYFVTAQDLGVEEHIAVQAAVQRWTDASVSKTVNVPKEMEYDQFSKVYDLAYSLGAKGCTTYRPSDVRGSILSIASEGPPPAEIRSYQETIPRRPEVLRGCTYQIKWPKRAASLYMTINEDADGFVREVLCASKDTTAFEWVSGLTLMMTAIFKKGGNIAFVAEELKQVQSITDSSFVDGKFYGSLVSYIGHLLERHFNGRPTEATTPQAGAAPSPGVHVIGMLSGEPCPSCHAPSVIHKEGCKACTNCGWSSC